MSEQPRPGDRKPQKGDMIRVSYNAVVDSVEDDGRVYVSDPSGAAWVAFVPPPAAVEVVEPADDPSKSLVGEVRREDHDKPNDPPGFSLWQKVVMPTIGAHPGTERQRWLCVLSSAPGNRGEYLDDEDVVGWHVIGAVPGTPAAEANPVPPQVLVRVREMLSNGQQIRAIKAIREVCVGMGLKEAKAYAESLPEWAEGDRALGDQIRDGLNLSPHGWEPRVFQADGPEPPEDAVVLEYLDFDREEHALRYLKRFEDRWYWVRYPDAQYSALWGGMAWPPNCPGRYREVQP